MTSITTKESALEVLKSLTAIHGIQPYFIKADVIYNDGFFCVDLQVDGEKWRVRDEKLSIPRQINRVPICILVYG